jgi:hypothetical protein
MLGYLVSLLMGLAVGAAYGLVQVRSPAPPMIALRRPLRHGARAAGGRHGEAPFRATRSDLHPSTRWAALRAVLTRLTLGLTAIPSYLPSLNAGGFFSNQRRVLCSGLSQRWNFGGLTC